MVIVFLEFIVIAGLIAASFSVIAHFIEQKKLLILEMTEEEEIREEAKQRNLKQIVVGIGAAVYFFVAILTKIYVKESIYSEILFLLAIGVGAGLVILVFSIELNFSTTKDLIRLEAKIDEINEKLN